MTGGNGQLAATTFFSRAGRGLLCIGLVAAITLKGGTIPLAFFSVCIAIGLAAFLSGFSSPANKQIRRAAGMCLGLAVSLAAYVLFQSWQFAGNPLANPIWDGLREVTGADVGGAISVEPSATRQALMTLLAPLVVYGTALRLFATDAYAFSLLKVLAIIGIAFALFGLVQIVFMPDSLLFFEKIHYEGSLTGVFVNRNTAGTFLGLSSFVVLIWLVKGVRETGGERPLLRLLFDTSVPSSQRVRCGALAGAFTAVLVAMFLTMSRGAMLATLASYLIVVPVLTLTMLKSDTSPATQPRRSIRVTAGLMAMGLVLVVFVAQLLGEKSTARLGADSVDEARLCVYDATLRAFADNWKFGTGFGTFDSVFPGYRTPDCGGVYGTFLRAHNSYLEGLLGLGIMFIPLLLFVSWQILRPLLDGYRTRRGQRYVAILGFGGVLTVGLHGLTDFSLQIPGMAMFFAAYLAAVTVICLGRSADRRRPAVARLQPDTAAAFVIGRHEPI